LAVSDGELGTLAAIMLGRVAVAGGSHNHSQARQHWQNAPQAGAGILSERALPIIRGYGTVGRPAGARLSSAIRVGDARSLVPRVKSRAFSHLAIWINPLDIF
jgi:hypothetical protein